MEYQNNLKSLRLMAGKRQADIASSLNIGQAEYSRIESGKRKITPHQPASPKRLALSKMRSQKNMSRMLLTASHRLKPCRFMDFHHQTAMA